VLARQIGRIAPASCSFSTPMICSSANLLRFISPSFVRAGL
jgi:hypothetical protein